MSDPIPVPEQPVETYESLASLLDLHLLGPTLSGDAVAAGCRTARAYGMRAVVVRPCDVELVVQWTRGTGLVVATVAGWPEGTSTTTAKLYEARDLLRQGAKEIEFVLNPAHMIARSFPHVETELMQIARSCHESGARLTVVFNNRWFADDLKIIATKICKRVEADFISIDPSEADLALFTPLLKGVLALKYASPVATLDDALRARDGGYTRIAITEPSGILEEWKQRLAAAAKPNIET